jgi:hemerythrin
MSVINSVASCSAERISEVVTITPTGHAVLDTVIERLLQEWQLVCLSSGQDFESRFEHLHEQVFLHCLEEEAMMQGAGYPQSESHLQDHLRLLQQMDDINVMLQSGFVEQARSDVCNRLLSGFALHVEQFGPDLASYLNSSDWQ